MSGPGVSEDPEAQKKKEEEADARRRYDFVVESDSFIDYPDALFCARLLKALLVLSILGCVAVLIITFLMGQLEISRDIYKYVAIEAPSVVICPDYGGGFDDFQLIRTTIGKLPGTSEPADELEHELAYECMDHNLHCRCVDFPRGTMLKHYDDAIDFIKVEFKAKPSSTSSDNFLFGFNEPGKHDVQEVPHTFNMGMLHRKTMGHLTMREISEKMDKIWGALTKFDTRSVRAYDYETAGLAVFSRGGNTELLFGFKTFFVAMDRSVSSMLSPFAIIVLLALIASYVNNLNLYDLVFPVTEKPVFVQREPNPFVRQLCACMSCTKKVDRDDEDPATDLENATDNHQSTKMKNHPWGAEHTKAGKSN